ncbi:MAG: Preprotein translocase, SecG subunit [candidate division WWE3 bacterium GW2011_GWB1_44_4]|uniref:Protein-export membrane protein SecG n=3 Tax=Bacteria candidate phyla TaxID=1783234 RepID=A0A1F5DZY9_9BACT|nr:MAG: Preprotein translocase, SecG subunit [candidate division WWE3 bacterium GW2011_GWB1_44_4]OGD56127.1 MAG: preprotein translocase subunit SecG [Candidatus Beckwithbacteria bacterium RIFCSPHIGHO2_12_FULL_47_17]OGD60673.1 MAG: preprotein translocase subunit SecG [Candidatus Beckwithbacteria bacterium RIFCSPLOWO2_02_FULL_47_23]
MPGLIIIQILVALSLIALILLQAKGGGLGTAFGGQSQVYHTKKGVEKIVFYLTIGLTLLLTVLALINLKL